MGIGERGAKRLSPRCFKGLGFAPVLEGKSHGAGRGTREVSGRSVGCRRGAGRRGEPRVGERNAGEGEERVGSRGGDANSCSSVNPKQCHAGAGEAEREAVLVNICPYLLFAAREAGHELGGIDAGRAQGPG